LLLRLLNIICAGNCILSLTAETWGIDRYTRRTFVATVVVIAAAPGICMPVVDLV